MPAIQLFGHKQNTNQMKNVTSLFTRLVSTRRISVMECDDYPHITACRVVQLEHSLCACVDLFRFATSRELDVIPSRYTTTEYDGRPEDKRVPLILSRRRTHGQGSAANPIRTSDAIPRELDILPSRLLLESSSYKIPQSFLKSNEPN